MERKEKIKEKGMAIGEEGEETKPAETKNICRRRGGGNGGGLVIIIGILLLLQALNVMNLWFMGILVSVLVILAGASMCSRSCCCCGECEQ